MASIHQKLQAYQKPDFHLIPWCLRLWNADQHELNFFEVGAMTSEPDKHMRYVAFSGNKYFMCWFYRSLNDVLLMQLTRFDVSPLDRPDKFFVCGQSVYH